MQEPPLSCTCLCCPHVNTCSWWILNPQPPPPICSYKGGGAIWDREHWHACEHMRYSQRKEPTFHSPQTAKIIGQKGKCQIIRWFPFLLTLQGEVQLQNNSAANIPPRTWFLQSPRWSWSLSTYTKKQLVLSSSRFHFDHDVAISFKCIFKLGGYGSDSRFQTGPRLALFN